MRNTLHSIPTAFIKGVKVTEDKEIHPHTQKNCHRLEETRKIRQNVRQYLGLNSETREKDTHGKTWDMKKRLHVVNSTAPTLIF